MASTLAASLASAQTSEDKLPPGKLETEPSASLNRFGLNYRMALNISAKFKGLGGYPAGSNPGPTPAGAPPRSIWNYDNGYVFEDIQGSASAQTWYWGYSGQPSVAAQVPGNDFLYLSRSSSLADVSSGARSDDPQLLGVELTYNRELGHINQATWGVEGAFNYLNFEVRDNRTLFGNVNVITDGYALNGVVPPSPEYYGDFQGPVPGGPTRPVISQFPTPAQSSVSTMAGGATISGERKLEADIYGFRVGPYAAVPITTKLSLSMSGGLALALVDSHFRFNETVTITGLNPVTNVGSGSRSEWLVGGYLGGSLIYSFDKSWSAAAGVQYQVLGHSSQTVAGKTAELDLQNSVFVTVGIGYSF